MLGHWFQKRKGPPRVAINAQVRQDQGTEQPAPHGSLVVSGVALRLWAFVMAALVCLGGIQTSQTMRRHHAPVTLPQPNPPSPLATSHSRSLPVSNEPQISGPNLTTIGALTPQVLP